MTRRRRRSDRSGRAPLVSPGRPPVAGRDERRQFWAAIAAGKASEDAAVEAGVSQAVGTRWFRKAGGMPPSMFRKSAKALSGRYLSFAEREEIALSGSRIQITFLGEIKRTIPRSQPTSGRASRAGLVQDAACGTGAQRRLVLDETEHGAILSRLDHQSFTESRDLWVTYRCRPIGQQSIVLRPPLESTQYTSIEFGRRCRDASVRPSMGSEIGRAHV